MGCFTPWPLYSQRKSPKHPLYRKLGAPTTGQHSVVKYMFVPATNRTPVAWSITSHHTDCTISKTYNHCWTQQNTCSGCSAVQRQWYFGLTQSIKPVDKHTVGSPMTNPPVITSIMSWAGNVALTVENKNPYRSLLRKPGRKEPPETPRCWWEGNNEMLVVYVVIFPTYAL